MLRIGIIPQVLMNLFFFPLDFNNDLYEHGQIEIKILWFHPHLLWSGPIKSIVH